LIGGNSGIYEGTRIGSRAVIAAGVVLTKSIKVYDLVKEQVIVAKGPDGVLSIPENAVVVPGNAHYRAISPKLMLCRWRHFDHQISRR
jgi:2,3,4,5-tetrahydropyridine-2-carboxylate N-succinyltransferase